MLCLALNVYTTNSCLSGNCGQSYYGFTVSGFGLGSSTCFLGSNGSELGLKDNGSCTINNLLTKIDSQCKSGVINSTACNAVNSLCSSINQI